MAIWALSIPEKCPKLLLTTVALNFEMHGCMDRWMNEVTFMELHT
jgi:hypothetical protein